MNAVRETPDDLIFTSQNSTAVQETQHMRHRQFLQIYQDIRMNRDNDDELIEDIPVRDADVQAMLCGASSFLEEYNLENLAHQTSIPGDSRLSEYITVDNPEYSIKPAADMLIFQLLLQQMEQEDTRSVMGLRSLRLPCGSLALSLWEDYFDIYSFIQEHNLSTTIGDNMLGLIKSINDRHGVVVPLPSTFKSIQVAMKRHEAHYARTKLMFNVTVPREIVNAKNCYASHTLQSSWQHQSSHVCQSSQHEDIVYAVGARGSVMEAVSTMLLKCVLVADPKTCIHTEITGQNIVSEEKAPLPVTFHAYDATVNVSINNTTEEVRVVCDMVSSEWFRDVEDEIHRFYQDNSIGVLNIVLSYDATSLTKTIGSTGRYATPLYVALGKTLF